MSLRLKVLTLAAAILVFTFAAGYSSAQNPTLKTAMREKLANTQRLLEAVVTADYAAIDRGVAALGRISETEIASWQVGASPEYRKQAMSFVRSVQGLHDAAAKRDIDAALAEYTALVSSCTRCHAYVRSSRVVSFEAPPSAKRKS
jgi:cytochrome c556